MAKYRKERDIPAIRTSTVVEMPPVPERYDARTREVYELLCADLIKRGRLETVGIHLIELYCDSYLIYRAAMDEISEMAKLTTKDRQADRKHPIYHVRRQALDEMLNMEKKLGISPYSRDRISVAEAEEEDDPMDL